MAWPAKQRRRTLDRLADAVGEFIMRLKVGLEPGALHRIQDGIGEVFLELNAVAAEAERESMTFHQHQTAALWCLRS